MRNDAASRTIVVLGLGPFGNDIVVALRARNIRASRAEPPSWEPTATLFVLEADHPEQERLVASGATVVSVTDGCRLTAIRSALRDGATAVLDRRAGAEEGAMVIELCLAGSVLLPADVVAGMARQVRGGRCRCADLDEAELALLRQVAAGRTVAMIARDANRSERDCYRLLAQLWRRMGETSRSGGIVHAVRCGLLDDG